MPLSSKNDPVAIHFCMVQAELESRRSGFDQYLSDIKKFVRPTTSDFYNGGPVPEVPSVNVDRYDSTAPWSATQLAAAFAGYLTPSNDRWADIVLGENREATHEEQLHLDEVSDIMYREFSDPLTFFVSAMQEQWLDIASFGQCYLFQELNVATRRLRFKSFPVADCWIQADAFGQIDAVHRRSSFTTRQMYQIFSPAILNQIDRVFKDQEKNVRHHEVIHIVTPNTPEYRRKYRIPHRYISLYILTTDKVILRAGGYHYFPYHVGRQAVVAGQVYSQSSAFQMLPTIKMLNAMMKTIIKAANKAVDPPTMVPSDGFLSPLSGDAGAVWWYDAAMMTPDAVRQFPMQGDPRLTNDLLRDMREQVMQAFNVEWIIRNKKNERQTATEIMDDRDEMLRQLAPTLGRLETEFVATIVRTSYALLKAAGRFPKAPASISGTPLEIRFQSPSARAQQGARGIDVQRYIQGIVPLAQVWPDIMDNIDPDGASKIIARAYNLPAIALRPKDEVDQMRADRAESEQQMQMLQAGKDAGKTAKDFASAEAIANG